jgi:hypothetical protein
MLKGSEVILTLEGSVPVSNVAGIMVAVYDEEEKYTYKLQCMVGDFTYKYSNFLESIVNSGEDPKLSAVKEPKSMPFDSDED